MLVELENLHLIMKNYPVYSFKYPSVKVKYFPSTRHKGTLENFPATYKNEKYSIIANIFLS